PELKQQERQRRAGVKVNAQQDYNAAEERGDTEAMKKYAARTTTLTTDMLSDAKKLLALLGIPCVQAPSEAEAQCAQMVTQGKAWAVASQDYDALVYGGLRVIQNLSIVGRRRKIHGKGTVMVQPVFIDLQENLTKLNLSHEQLIRLSMLVGTDFNYGGIKGIGPKKALALVKKHLTSEELFAQVNWNSFITTPWQQVYETIAHIPVDSAFLIPKVELDVDALQTFLIDEHDFNPERVRTTLQSLLKRPRNQTALGEYFS
ncbi:MAG: flap structure-specific endonuclease, partial [Candidatus Woesearchaeota archaeon]|nr:flap structure-specific endonuclease [Candidatus Woesearchaeota archaeon]